MGVQEGLGWASALLLAGCGVPAAAAALRARSCAYPPAFLWAWWAGEVLGVGCVLVRGDYPLILNYAVNCVCTTVLLIYSRRPK